MNQTDIVKFVNEILGTEYADFGQLRPLDIAKVDLAVQVDAHLRARVSPEQPDIAPQACKFSELDDGALFLWPVNIPEPSVRYEKDVSQVAQRDCRHCGMAQANARSIESAEAPWHFCPDFLVLPVKEGPKDSTTLFYKLEPGELFVIPGVRMGTHEKLAIPHQTGVLCPRENCPVGEAWLNAKNGSDVFVHICPDTVVLPVPF